MTKKAIFISTLSYNSSYHVGTHSLAKVFAENGWKVAFVSDPISPLHFISGQGSELIKRYELWKRGGQSSFDGKIWAYVPFSMITTNNYPILRSDYVYKNWAKFAFPGIVSLLKKNGFEKVDLIYADNSRFSFLLENIPHLRSVFRVTDNYKSNKNFSQTAFRFDKMFAGRCDFTLYTAKSLREFVDELEPLKPEYFPNGADIKMFSQKSSPEPHDLMNIPHPRVIYAGETKLRFDAELVRKTAESLPLFSFVIIGENDHLKNFFSHNPNVYLLGFKDYNLLHRYFSNCDIGIIPFDISKNPELIKYVNPLKLYQYLSAGLQVVTTSWKEIELLNPSVFIAKTEDEFVKYVSESSDLLFSPEIISEFLKGNDWQQRYNQLFEMLFPAKKLF
ncbi:MAG: glycosyltransferase [Ignavibacteriales bacterium]|nr:glycosyltransferase [Ignavibacteriales bacterium]MCF8305454.1 glycosyltransferase [Ignavibacteriales bacterium]MCF8316137.1 glycosyltransferase [Ignavibacteriales bacterium]MCF8436639.1 glycosyltransferase [Ignavibacteriales bacterium]